MCWCLAYMAPHLFSHLITLCVPHPGLYHKNRDLTQRIRHSYVQPQAQLCMPGYVHACSAAHAPGMDVLLLCAAARASASAAWLSLFRYVLAFQLPWLGEAALCVNDYALLESVLVNGPGGCNPGTVSQEASVPSRLLTASSHAVLQ